MKREISKLLAILACPQCHGELVSIPTGVYCRSCDDTYELLPSGQYDLRLKRPKKVEIMVEVGSDLPVDNYFLPLPLATSINSGIDYQELTTPNNLSLELVSHFPKPRSIDAPVIDIGCGDGRHRDILEQIGYKWVGLDIDGSDATLLGDAHALPLTSECTDFVLSMHMAYELRYPWIFMNEVFRVLKPGGMYIGAIPFLEPYMFTSYYYPSHMGVYNYLHSAGFEVIHVCPSEKWNALVALATMALFPKLPRTLARAAVIPIEMMHKLWWKLGYIVTKHEQISERYRIARISGGSDFVAQKPVNVDGYEPSESRPA